jgi:hypothetical protein
MNLSYNEMDDLENKGGNNNYWNTVKTKDSSKKPKFGYDDILSSINLVVNNGVLQYMTPSDNNSTTNNNSVIQQNSNPTTFITNQPYQQSQQPTIKKISVDPQVKNSAIYNKYFKNYHNPNEVPEVKVPKTKEELVQMLIEEHNKKIELQKRLAMIKPKKMFFAASNHDTSIPIYTSQNTMNRLFKFK